MNADPQPCPEAWCANNDHHISNKLNYFYTFLIDQAIVLTARLRTQIWVRVWIQNIVVFLLFIFNQSFIDVYPQNNLTSGWSPVPCPGGRGHVQSAPGTHCHPARYLLGRGTGSLCCSGKGMGGGGGAPRTPHHFVRHWHVGWFLRCYFLSITSAMHQLIRQLI